MFTVALIGGDGAGKTTVANYLVENLPYKVKYLYMGMSTISGNSALPTTKLVRYIKKRMYKKPGKKKPEGSQPNEPSSNDLHYSYEPRSFIWKIARFFNRMMETSWRQLLTAFYRLRGYIVLYDRYILFDAAPKNSSGIRIKRFFDSIEYLILYYLFPKPDLVIFLDAPAEVLYSRKGEASIKHLNSRRKATLRLGKSMKNFVRIDATLPLTQVLDEVTLHIKTFHDSRSSRRRWQVFMPRENK